MGSNKKRWTDIFYFHFVVEKIKWFLASIADLGKWTNTEFYLTFSFCQILPAWTFFLFVPKHIFCAKKACHKFCFDVFCNQRRFELEKNFISWKVFLAFWNSQTWEKEKVEDQLIEQVGSPLNWDYKPQTLNLSLALIMKLFLSMWINSKNLFAQSLSSN